MCVTGPVSFTLTKFKTTDAIERGLFVTIIGKCSQVISVSMATMYRRLV